jgi:hypothetical protein
LISVSWSLDNLFDQPSKRSVVQRDPELGRFSFVGSDLSDDWLLRLSAAPAGSTVRAYFKEKWTKKELGDDEMVPGGLVLEVTHPELIATKNEIILFSDDAKIGLDGYGVPSIYMKLIDMRQGEKLPKGTGGAITERIVRAAQECSIPFKKIHLMAAGGRVWADRDEKTGDRWVGYSVWPKYGFDMKLISSDLTLFKRFQYFPRGVSSVKTVSDLLALPQGLEFWKMNGSGLYMEFELDSKSKSSSTLENFSLKQKGSVMKAKKQPTSDLISTQEVGKFDPSAVKLTSIKLQKPRAKIAVFSSKEQRKHLLASKNPYGRSNLTKAEIDD